MERHTHSPVDYHREASALIVRNPDVDEVIFRGLLTSSDAERGLIALAPSFRIPNGIPQDKLYFLKMSDISQVQPRSKLVVLSCCHSAHREIIAEEAVEIARACIGSDARSVLVARWAIDSSTELFMSHFYDHLVPGESASDSLHQAMRWIRCNGYSDSDAFYILIGDNVTFDFRLSKVGLLEKAFSAS